MSNDGFEQLSAIAGLSRQREGLSLTRAFIDCLRQLAPGAGVSIMEVYGHRGTRVHAGETATGRLCIRRFDDTGQRLDTRETATDLDHVIATMKPRAVEKEGRGVGQLVVPLGGDIGPLRLVVLDDIASDPWLRAKVMQVVEVYGNLIQLMDSRERDALTGLLNRQTFASLFELAAQREALADSVSLAVATLDIDNFKRVNDNFGHLSGDEVLSRFAHLMERSFRYTDDLFRFGGEEFVVLLSTVVPDSAGAALERFRRVIEAHEFPGVGHITVSIGYASASPDRLPTSLLDCADQALYHAKSSGRNRVVNFSDMVQRAPHVAGAIDLT